MLVQDSTVKAGIKDSIVSLIKHDSAVAYATSTSNISSGPAVLDLQNVIVKYGDCVVRVRQISAFCSSLLC